MELVNIGFGNLIAARAAHRRGKPGFGPHQATHSGDKGRRDAHRRHLWPKNGVGTYYGQ